MKKRYFLFFIITIILLQACGVAENRESSSTELSQDIQNPTKEEMAEAFSKIEVGNIEFDDYINNTILLSEDELIEKTECLEKDICYRVAIKRTEEDEWGYDHLKDYFFIKEDFITHFVVDYPSKSDYANSDRYPWDACGFEAEYKDITFDGNRDIVICLGDAGTSAAKIHCAYIYEEGNFIYKKSFEQILGYTLNEEEKCIEGMYRSGNQFWKQKAIYKDGEFVIEEESIIE